MEAESVAEKFQELVDGWEVSLSGQPQKLNGSLELLLKMFNNIGTNPMEQKFRKIKATNPTIKEKLFSLAGMGEFLQKLGFTHSVEGSDEFYVLDDSKLGILLPFIQHLRDRIALIEAKQDGPDEYQRVKNVIENQQILHKQQELDRKKEKEVKETFEFDKQERKYIEVKDSIAVNMNQKRQESPLQVISGDADFKTKVLQNEKPVIVDFYADWCAPCRKLGELIDQELNESKGWVVAKVNCDDPNNADIKKRHNVSGIPAIFFYHKGQQVSQHCFTGCNTGALKNAIEKAIQLGKQ